MQSLPSCSISYLPPSPSYLQTKHIAFKNFKPFSNSSTNPTLFYFNLYLKMCVKSASMNEAQKVFDAMPDRTLISWTILMSGYARHGPVFEVLLMFRSMVLDYQCGLFQPDSFVFSIVLRACAELRDLGYGRWVHVHLLKRNGVMDSFVENALLGMYASCGCLVEADTVFKGIEKPDLVACGTMLNGYVKNGHERKGLEFFLDMFEKGVKPDTFLLSTLIGACRKPECLEFGIQIHCYLIKMGFECYLFLENSLMDFYAKYGDLEGMRLIFSMMIEKNLVSWNTLITGYVNNAKYLEALRVFQVLIREVNQFDDITITSTLEAITSTGDIRYGKELHGYIIRMGLDSNLRVISSVLAMYIECDDLNSLSLRENIPLKLLHHLEGALYDEFIIASMLKWCSMKLDLEMGMMLHSLVIKLRMLSDPYIVNSLIYMYSNCGIFEASQMVFFRANDPGIASWSALISGYSYNGLFREALKLFGEMQLLAIKADEFVFTSVLFACLALGNLNEGKEIHCKILRSGYESNSSVINMLINLYSELWHHKQALKLCGLILDAEIEWKLLIRACSKANDYEMIHKILKRI